MFPQKIKKLIGVTLFVATVPAAIFLAPRIGGWTIALVLGLGAAAGWLTAAGSGVATAGTAKRRGVEDEIEPSIYDDPKYSGIPGNVHNFSSINHDVD